MQTSIIIAARNAEATIAEAVSSSLSEGLAVAEVIVVDDDSTDTTPDVVKSLAVADHRVRLLRTAKHQAGAARNVGASVAGSDWLGFLDADDRVSPGSIGRRLELLRGRRFDPKTAAAGGVTVFGRRRTRTLRARPMRRRERDRCARGWVMPYHISSLLVHRSSFEHIGGFDEEVGVITPAGGEDVIFVSDLIRSGIDVVVDRGPAFEYRISRESASGQRRSELAVAAAFARSVAAARNAEVSPPDARFFAAANRDEIVARRSTRAEVRLRRALIEAMDGSPPATALHLGAAFLEHPAYVAWRLIQRGFSPHDERFGRP